MRASLTAFRRRVGAFIGGFEAGLANRRLKGFQPSRAHLNTLIAAAGPDITARARWLIRNNGYAANAIESWAGNVVGSGIKPSSLIGDPELKADVQKLWLDWTDEADSEGFTDLYGLQRRAAREVFIAGEVFFRFRPRRPQDGLTVPLQLQMDKREQIMVRLVEIAAAVPGINTAVRNQDELSERKRPAVAIFDADEAADEASERQDHPGRAPNIVVMTPEVMILLGAAPATVGSSLNSLRAKLVKAVLTDAQLTAIVGTNGRVRYAGCSTHLGHGRSMEGFMGVHFAFAYVLRPEQL